MSSEHEAFYDQFLDAEEAEQEYWSAQDEEIKKLKAEIERLNKLVFAYESVQAPVNPLLAANEQLKEELRLLSTPIGLLDAKDYATQCPECKCEFPAVLASRQRKEIGELKKLIVRFKACNGSYDLIMLMRAIQEEEDKKNFTDYNI